MDLPVIEKAAELCLDRPRSMRRLLLVGAKRPQLPMRVEDLLHGGGTEATDQLVLQIGFADVEAEPFHVRAAEVGTKAGTFKSAPDLSFFSRVAETRQPDVGSIRPVQVQEAADRLRAPDRPDANALGGEIPAASYGERLHCDLVADTFDEHDCTRTLDFRQSADSERAVTRAVQVAWRPDDVQCSDG